MKKIVLSLTLLLASLILSINVNASSFNASIIGNDTFEDEITLYIQVNNLVDFNGDCNGLCGLVGNLEYDTSKIELASISALENFDLTEGKTLVLYKSTGVGSDTKVLSMKFKNKSLKKDESTTITFSNIVASDGDKDVNTSNASKIIKFIVREIETTTTTTTKKTTTKKTTTKKTTKKVEIKKSNNNYLSSINLSEGNINFDKNILIYDITVDNETTTLEVKATPEHNKAIITGVGNHTLNVGENVIKITIKAEDKTERTYTLNVNRKAKEIIVDDEVIENDNIEKEKTYVIPIIIVSIILVIGLISFVIWKNKKSI